LIPREKQVFAAYAAKHIHMLLKQQEEPYAAYAANHYKLQAHPNAATSHMLQMLHNIRTLQEHPSAADAAAVQPSQYMTGHALSTQTPSH
jgi:hypothetical protein